MDSSLVAEVRRASDLTMQVGTARISYAMEFRAGVFGGIVDILAASEKDPPLGKTASGLWSLIGGGIKLAEKAADGKTTSSEGVADFRSGRGMTTRRMHRRQVETYFEPGRLLERRPGERWREKLTRFEGSFKYSPMWLVELPRGATEAVALGDEPVDGAPCRHVSGMADPQQAATRSIHGMEPVVARRASGQAVPFEVWIDSSGRLRRVRAAIQITDAVDAGQQVPGGTYDLTLRDLGTAPSLPAADDVEPVGERRPLAGVGEALVSAWVQRLREILPAGATLEYDEGERYRIRVRRASGGGVFSSQTPMLELMLPGTAEQKLERALRTQAETVQDLICTGLKIQWPGPGAKPHVEVGSEQIEVWWSLPATPQETLRLRPIPRAELGM